MADSSEGRKKRSRFRKWRWVFAAVAVLAGLFALYVEAGKRDVARRLAALRAAGYPTSMAEFAEYNRLPEGTANAADMYRRAAASLAPAGSQVSLPFGIWGKLPDRKVLLSESTVQANAGFLAANRDCLSLLHQAGAIEDCWYGCDVANDLPPLKDIVSCARLLALNAASQALAGDPNAAMTSMRDGLRLGDSFHRGPGGISYIARVACYAAAIHALEQASGSAVFTDEQLRELDSALAATDDSLDLVQPVVTEGCLAIDYLMHSSKAGGPAWFDTALRFPGVRRNTIIGILGHKLACIEAARLPETERLARFRRIDDELREPPESDLLARFPILRSIVRPLGLNRIAEMVTPRMDTLVEFDLRIHALIDLARTALAIERFRLATGTLPAGLAELVPQYLEVVPIDPFDAQPIRYRPAPPSAYTLYSIDKDARDDGGRDPDPNDSRAPSDLCFTVTR